MTFREWYETIYNPGSRMPLYIPSDLKKTFKHTIQ